MLLVHV